MPETSERPALSRRAGPLLAPPVRRELGAAALAALLSMLLAAAVLGLWDADLGVPFEYVYDGNFNQALVKSVLENGWYQENPALAAPYGMELYDFPVVAGDNLSILIVKFLGLFSSDSATVMNLFFLVTFPLITLSAYLAMRLLGLLQRTSVVCAVLYSLLPYRFERGEVHLWLTAYYAVPLGACMALALLLRVQLFTRRERGRGVFRWASGRSLLVLAACVVVASAQVYFAAFTMILVAAAAALVFLTRRDRAAVVSAAVLIAAIGGVTLMHHLPTVLYRAEHGSSPGIERIAADTERFGLRIARLVVPVKDHRLAPLASLSERYDETDHLQLYEGQSQALGLAGTVGFVWLTWLALSATLRPGRAPPRPLPRALAAITLVAVLVGTIGGVSSLVGHFLTAELRSWSRMVVFIAFFSLVAFGLLLERVPRVRTGSVGLAVLAAVLGLAVLDQSSTRYVPDYEAVAAQYSDEEAFVAEIERRVPPGAALFQLPYIPFPEPQLTGSVTGLGPYDMLRGYLHSSRLRWSYGSIKGRQRDWQGRLVQLPLSLVLPAVVAVGFQGVYVDRAGYEDDGDRVVGDLRQALGVAPLSSARGRLEFFDLRPYAARIRGGGSFDVAALRRAALSPVYAEHGSGFGPTEADGLVQSRGFSGRAILSVVNTGREPRRVRFDGRLKTGDGRAAVTIAFPDGATTTVDPVTAEDTRIGREFTVAPGRHPITFSVRTRPPSGGVGLVEPRVVDAALAAFAPGPTPFAPPSRLVPFGLR